MPTANAQGLFEDNPKLGKNQLRQTSSTKTTSTPSTTSMGAPLKQRKVLVPQVRIELLFLPYQQVLLQLLRASIQHVRQRFPCGHDTTYMYIYSLIASNHLPWQTIYIVSDGLSTTISQKTTITCADFAERRMNSIFTIIAAQFLRIRRYLCMVLGG